MEDFVKNAKNNSNARFNNSPYSATNLNGTVKLFPKEFNGNGSIVPITITEFFKTSCQRFALRPALVVKLFPKMENDCENFGKKWTTYSYMDYAERVQQAAKMLIHIGLQKNETVGILANNCPEWYFLQFGILNAGGIVFGMCRNSRPDEIYQMLSVTQAAICVVDSSAQLEKVGEVSARLPLLRVILQLQGINDESQFGSKIYYCLYNAMNLNFDESVIEELKKRESEQIPTECAMMVLKSVPIGKPKAIMLSHDNIISNVKATYYSQQDNICWGEGRLVSYLPLNHIAAQSFDVFGSLLTGSCVYFADDDALKGTLVKTLREVKPTMFLAVPKVYEKLEERLKFEHKRKGRLSTYIENTARDAVTLNKFYEANCSVPVSIKDTFANYIIENTRKVVGMQYCNLFICCGQPLKENTQNFFVEFNVNIVYTHMISELAGPVTMNTSPKKLRSIGKQIDGTILKIRKQKAKSSKGEILFSGRSVFMGYFNEPLETAAVIDGDGWFHTRELGYVDSDGYLFKTGVLKQVIRTSNGATIVPQPIERALKQELPALSNAMIVGDKRKYLTLMLTLKTKPETTLGLPTDNLHVDTTEWLASLGLKFQKLSSMIEALKCDKKSKIASKIMRSIASHIENVNNRMPLNAERIQKFLLLRHDFSEATGELGPYFNIRRKFVLKKYAKQIDEMYR